MVYASVLFVGNASLYSAVIIVLSTLVSIGRRMLHPEAGVQSQVAIAVVTKAFQLAGSSADKVNVGAGAYGDDHGKRLVLERRIAGSANMWLIPSAETRSAGQSVTVCVNLLLLTFVTAQAFLFFSGRVLVMSAKNVTEAFLADRANKVSVGVGAYREDQHGKPVVSEGVREAGRRITGSAKMHLFIITFLAILNLCRADLQPKDIFILAGQSNMSGRGGAIVNKHTWDGHVPPECKPSPFIFRFNRNFTWEEAREPLHYNIDCTTTCGVGPGMPFAKSLLKLQHSVNSIGLVPCAAGGTRLVEWNQTGQLYKMLIERTRASLESGGVLRALLWYQGESDTSSFEDARFYRTRFEKFVNDVRADLVSPTLPIIQVALASGKYYPYIKMVRAAQLGLRLPNLTCVDAWNLKLEPDQLHLTTHSQILLGKKIARAFIAHHY